MLPFSSLYSNDVPRQDEQQLCGGSNVNWIYGDSQDLNDFSSDGVRNTVAHLQQILLYINNLLGNNSI